jgi:hypothetical protein
MIAVVPDASIGFDNSVPVTLKVLPVKESKVLFIGHFSKDVTIERVTHFLVK